MMEKLSKLRSFDRQMKWSPPGRRKRGRPKATWAEGIRGLMGEKGLTLWPWSWTFTV